LAFGGRLPKRPISRNRRPFPASSQAGRRFAATPAVFGAKRACFLAGAARLHSDGSPRSRRFPTLIRFLIILGGLVALAYGGIYYLATYVKIAPHEITETVELPKAPK
jgi:hypothetical protein